MWLSLFSILQKQLFSVLYDQNKLANGFSDQTQNFNSRGVISHMVKEWSCIWKSTKNHVVQNDTMIFVLQKSGCRCRRSLNIFHACFFASDQRDRSKEEEKRTARESEIENAAFRMSLWKSPPSSVFSVFSEDDLLIYPIIISFSPFCDICERPSNGDDNNDVFYQLTNLQTCHR